MDAHQAALRRACEAVRSATSLAETFPSELFISSVAKYTQSNKVVQKRPKRRTQSIKEKVPPKKVKAKTNKAIEPRKGGTSRDSTTTTDVEPDGFQDCTKRSQFNLMQLESLDRVKLFMVPEVLPDRPGYLINFCGVIRLHQSLLDHAHDKAWDVYDDRSVNGFARESAYKENQKCGAKEYFFDQKTAAAADAFKTIVSEMLSFLKACVKTPSAFYNFINIAKPRNCAYPYQMIQSLGEPYRRVFDLAWRTMSKSEDREEQANIFCTMSNYKMKQILAETLHKIRQGRRLKGTYDDEEDDDNTIKSHLSRKCFVAVEEEPSDSHNA